MLKGISWERAMRAIDLRGDVPNSVKQTAG